MGDGEQAQHDDDQINPGGQPRLIEREAPGVVYRLQSDGLKEDAETQQGAGGHALPLMGHHHEHHPQEGCHEDLARPEEGRYLRQDWR